MEPIYEPLNSRCNDLCSRVFNLASMKRPPQPLIHHLNIALLREHLKHIKNPTYYDRALRTIRNLQDQIDATTMDRKMRQALKDERRALRAG